MVATLYVYAAMFLQQQSATGSNWDLRTMWSQMSILPRAVVITLFILSIYSFGVMIDRALMYSAARKQSRIFVQQVAGALKDGKLDEAIAIAERNKKSHIAKVVATGLSEFQSASCGPKHPAEQWFSHQARLHWSPQPRRGRLAAPRGSG